MADSFQLKAIITAVDQLSGPLKGMQRELKGFQKEMAGLALGPRRPELRSSVRLPCRLTPRWVSSRKWPISARWLMAWTIKQPLRR